MNTDVDLCLVWCEPGHDHRNWLESMPRVAHQTSDSAVAEAQRLAKRHPGRRFHVVQIVATCEATINPPVTTFYSGRVGL